MGRQEKAPKKSIDGIWVGLAPAPPPNERALPHPPFVACCASAVVTYQIVLSLFLCPLIHCLLIISSLNFPYLQYYDMRNKLLGLVDQIT